MRRDEDDERILEQLRGLQKRKQEQRWEDARMQALLEQRDSRNRVLDVHSKVKQRSVGEKQREREKLEAQLYQLDDLDDLDDFAEPSRAKRSRRDDDLDDLLGQRE